MLGSTELLELKGKHHYPCHNEGRNEVCDPYKSVSTHDVGYVQTALAGGEKQIKNQSCFLHFEYAKQPCASGDVSRQYDGKPWIQMTCCKQLDHHWQYVEQRAIDRSATQRFGAVRVPYESKIRLI